MVPDFARGSVRVCVRCQLLFVTLAVVLMVTSRQTQAASGRPQRPRSSLEINQKKHQELHQRFALSLEKLAGFCDDKLLIEPARQVREAAVPVDRNALRADSLPQQVQPEIGVDLPADERYWQVQLRFQRAEYAKELYLLSRRVLRAGYPSYAYNLVREVARHDPDHQSSRRILGFERYGDRWVTPFAASMLRKRYDWHADFGWLPKAHIVRYERGERCFKGRWVSAAKEATLRRDFRHAWEIRTDHYVVKTNHSLERGAELGEALEDFYGLFFQTFAGFFQTPEQLRKLFEGTGSRSSTRNSIQPYQVHFYVDAAEYHQRLIKRYPQITITNGLYEPDDRVVYFFQNPDENTEATLFHEATHQLFAENQLKRRAIADDANFWAVEGIACYMESYQRSGRGTSLGDPRYIRFELARTGYLDGAYYIPLAQFATMGKTAFQSHPEISRNYSQASGLAHFFMHADSGRYRDALIEHLSQIYNGDPRTRGRVQSLEELTGVAFPELDRQYGAYQLSVRQAVDNQQLDPANSLQQPATISQQPQ